MMDRIVRKCAAVSAGICILWLMALAGCGGEPMGDADASGYVFEAGGVKIAMDADMGPIAKALGEPLNYFEDPSCAAQGIAKRYIYAGFEVITYPEGDKDLVAGVILKDDTVATSEGVDLSMAREQVMEAYGSGTEATERSVTYAKGSMKLRFLFEGERIVSIEYSSGALE